MTSFSNNFFMLRNIVSRVDAIKEIRDASITFLFLSVIHMVIGFLGNRAVLIDASILALIALLLWILKWRIFAISLLILAVFSATITILNFIGISDLGGRNILLTFIMVCGGIRAVQATFMLHAIRLKEDSQITGGISTTEPYALKPPRLRIFNYWREFTKLFIFSLLPAFILLPILGPLFFLIGFVSGLILFMIYEYLRGGLAYFLSSTFAGYEVKPEIFFQEKIINFEYSDKYFVAFLKPIMKYIRADGKIKEGSKDILTWISIETGIPDDILIKSTEVSLIHSRAMRRNIFNYYLISSSGSDPFFTMLVRSAIILNREMLIKTLYDMLVPKRNMITIIKKVSKFILIPSAIIFAVGVGGVFLSEHFKYASKFFSSDGVNITFGISMVATFINFFIYMNVDQAIEHIDKYMGKLKIDK
ncbi:hypothetical protein ACFL4G_10240 [Thermodesulfobacteriota bacterium]